MIVTFAALLRVRAADKPPGPAPTIATFGSACEEEGSTPLEIAIPAVMRRSPLHLPIVRNTARRRTGRCGWVCQAALFESATYTV